MLYTEKIQSNKAKQISKTTTHAFKKKTSEAMLRRMSLAGGA